MRQSVPVIARSALPATEQPNLLRSLVLATVFLAVATSGIVFAEPAPVDVLTLGLVIALPIMRLVRVTPLLVGYLAGWLVVAAAAFVASLQAMDPHVATVHTAISLYLSVASFVIAGFVAVRPQRHIRLLLDAYLVAALIAAVFGLAGYFELVPGAGELFTRFDRATGAFKDPNVFGPFLVPAMIYLVHKVLTRPLLRTVVPLVLLAFLGLALVVSFSRGAWINLAIAGSVYWLITLATTNSAIRRLQLIASLGFGLLAAGAALVGALQIDSVARMFDERAAILQSYDVGPEGRFGGQSKAIETILDNPLGIGALNFTGFVHHEDAHNVYLSMLLNAGWAGGLFYLALVVATLGIGFSHALKRTPTQGHFAVVYACLAAVALEGLIIDTDHWRHFYLLMGVVWGLMAAAQPARVLTTSTIPHRRRRAARITGRFISALPSLAALRSPRRPARITGFARSRLPRHIAVPRRPRLTPPRRPPRIAYR
ncbi:MAG: hypothetical protein R3D27_05560 [Hyphomicrobiaceae bacterium]